MSEVYIALRIFKRLYYICIILNRPKTIKPRKKKLYGYEKKYHWRGRAIVIFPFTFGTSIVPYTGGIHIQWKGKVIFQWRNTMIDQKWYD